MAIISMKLPEMIDLSFLFTVKSRVEKSIRIICNKHLALWRQGWDGARAGMDKWASQEGESLSGNKNAAVVSGWRGMSSLWYHGKRKQMKLVWVIWACSHACFVWIRGQKPGRNLVRRCSRKEAQRQLCQRKSVGLFGKIGNGNLEMTMEAARGTNLDLICRKLDRYEERKMDCCSGTGWRQEEPLWLGNLRF